MSVARGKRPQTEGADHIMPRRKDNSTALPGNIASSASKRPRRNATADITVGCLFAAIGGFAKAFEQNGASVLWANEKDRFASETFRANFPAVRQIHKPIEELTVAGDSLEPVDVLTGGFPCQPFSIAGEAKGFKDDRGLLFLHIIRLSANLDIESQKFFCWRMSRTSRLMTRAGPSGECNLKSRKPAIGFLRRTLQS